MTAGAGHRLLVIAGSQLRHEDADGPADPAAGRQDLRGADRRAPGPGRHSAHGRGWGAPLRPPEAPSSLTSALVTAAVSVLCIPAGRSPRTLRCWVSVASSSGPSLVLASLLLPVSLLSPTHFRKQAKKKKKKDNTTPSPLESVHGLAAGGGRWELRRASAHSPAAVPGAARRVSLSPHARARPPTAEKWGRRDEGEPFTPRGCKERMRLPSALGDARASGPLASSGSSMEMQDLRPREAHED